MLVRGAPLIGATAAYGVALAMRVDASDAALDRGLRTSDRDATDGDQSEMGARRDDARGAAAAAALRRAPPPPIARAGEIAEQDIAINKGIGQHGLALIEAIAASKKPGERVNVLTHCNAGWLATVDCGTATAPIYLAHDKGLPFTSGSMKPGRAIRAPR